jgi:hypothetical protein
MPYEPSEEGASAAVNLALAAGRPIVASPSAIFRPVADVIRIASRHSPDAYVKALDGILSDPSVARELTQKAVTWAEENSYAVTVRNLLTMANQQDVVHRIQGVNCA